MANKWNEIEQRNHGIVIANPKQTAEYRRIVRACKRGKLIRLRRGVYAFPSALATTIPDIESIIPHGVMCLFSAFWYHKLTTHIPTSTCVAISANRVVKTPQYPPIDLYYWKNDYLLFGIQEVIIDGYIIRITDLERTVCDAIRYRNKIGIDTMGEVLSTYMKRHDRNITLLNTYAKQLRVFNTLSLYLQPKL